MQRCEPWHSCDLCRLLNAPKDCKHEDEDVSEGERYLYCEGCGAVARKLRIEEREAVNA